MKQYLLSVYQPDGEPPPPEELGKIMADVEAWSQELKDAVLTNPWTMNPSGASTRRTSRIPR